VESADLHVNSGLALRTLLGQTLLSYVVSLSATKKKKTILKHFRQERIPNPPTDNNQVAAWYDTDL